MRGLRKRFPIEELSNHPPIIPWLEKVENVKVEEVQKTPTEDTCVPKSDFRFGDVCGKRRWFERLAENVRSRRVT